MSSSFFSINSRTSTLWKLNSDRTKIVEGHSTNDDASGIRPIPQYVVHQDPLFNIITSTEHYGSTWVKQNADNFCSDCPSGLSFASNNKDNTTSVNKTSKPEQSQYNDNLSCGKPANFTFYDNLVGVMNRNTHPSLVEPEAMIEFIRKYKFKPGKPFDLDILANKLIQIKREKPKSVSTYHQLGNFWRVKGDPKQAIECFRKALAVSPHNAEILLNLAKVLFHLQYLDDAIYLTRRSLEVAPPEKGAWQQYFTLGEIFKAYGHYYEAQIHFRHTLDLNPGFEPAIRMLKEMEEIPSSPMHFYTMVIIICLVLAVLLAILTSFETDNQNEINRSQKSFSKNSGIRSIRNLTWTNRRPKRITT
ncbi:hypothetical protein GWI33_000093 [Rhynchophorus ferrugineus]|uniref:Tetratricopeptide repeat protein 17-like protein n=1 Tax=Rhynchophorus ferrugineus TaxID=354439 RepID=A0A834IVJ4_RHYFE|nr:hypothetical protein GWI33_000093 [Rhynchophorus ferrugineus]